MIATPLQRLKLVDFKIGHSNSFYFLFIISESGCFTYINAYVVSFIICCHTINIIHKMYDACLLRRIPRLWDVKNIVLIHMHYE